ncbi:MAG: M28 family peptidase [Thermomicrobiaceae bacterium]
MQDRMERILSEVNADRLMATTRSIAQWERLSGSDGEREAFDYIQSELETLGFRCQRHHPVCLVSIPLAARLEIIGEPEPIHCITHSFSVSTHGEGLELELADLGSGSTNDYASVNAAGKAVLLEGLATPNTVAPTERAGAAAVIHNSGDQIHEMTISPVWGSPTPSTIQLLPRIPHVSVDSAGAARLRAALALGTVRVRIKTDVETQWKPLPVLLADLPETTEHTMHVLLSGHVDSWYYGAMDNGSANASMLEAARLMSSNSDQLRHGLRLAFWSGHSHARYATSAWYADEYWSFTHHYCLAHVNIDSPGGIGATDLTAASTMAESFPLASEIFKSVADANLAYDRIGRLGDQSFWGTGVPSFYCSISQQPPAESPTGIGALLGRGGGLGWWWHTADDTMDKLDPAFLKRDARLLIATVYRLCTARRLEFDQAGPAREILEALTSLQETAGEDLDLSGSIELAQKLIDSASRLGDNPPGDAASDDELALYNGCVTGVSRILIPVNYTVSGEFEQDPAVPGEPLPGLQPVRRLAELRQMPDAYYPWITKLRRERNRLNQALTEATSLIDQTMAVLEMGDEW